MSSTNSCWSVIRLCPTLCNPMDCSIPDFPALHYLPKFAQTRVHWVSNAIQSSHLLTPSPVSIFSQRQSLFQQVGSSHQVAKGLEFQLHYQSFQWIFRDDFLKDWLVWSPCCSGDSRVFSITTVWKHQFITQPSLWSNPCIHTWLLEKP